MQKFLSFLIVFIISVFPVVNASAAASSCNHMMDESMSQSMSSEAMADLSDVDDTSTMMSMTDCCDAHEVVCDHVNACDCDNSQVSYSAVPSIQVVNSLYLGSFKPRYISSLFHSKTFDSLYRPPITTLI